MNITPINNHAERTVLDRIRSGRRVGGGYILAGGCVAISGFFFLDRAWWLGLSVFAIGLLVEIWGIGRMVSATRCPFCGEYLIAVNFGVSKISKKVRHCYACGRALDVPLSEVPVREEPSS